MKSVQVLVRKEPGKASTGIGGFDEITGRGLAHGRTTFFVGRPGPGKTNIALRFLMHGVQGCKGPGIFVTFEENSKHILANAEGFGWNLDQLHPKQIYFMDGQRTSDLVQSGDLDVGEMLAAQANYMGTRRIVFDVLDAVLDLLQDVVARRRETHWRSAWLGAEVSPP